MYASVNPQRGVDLSQEISEAVSDRQPRGGGACLGGIGGRMPSGLAPLQDLVAEAGYA